jgi:hypothetical protein
MAGNIKNISNDGVWHVGDTVTFDGFVSGTPGEAGVTSGPILPHLIGYLLIFSTDAETVEDAIVNLNNSEWSATPALPEGNIPGSFFTFSFVVPNLDLGTYYLKWAVDTLDEFLESNYSAWEAYPITIEAPVPPVPSNFTPAPVVPARPDTYDPDAAYDPVAGTWSDVPAAGGGAYKDVIILIGGGGEIFLGDV